MEEASAKPDLSVQDIFTFPDSTALDASQSYKLCYAQPDSQNWQDSGLVVRFGKLTRLDALGAAAVPADFPWSIPNTHDLQLQYYGPLDAAAQITLVEIPSGSTTSPCGFTPAVFATATNQVLTIDSRLLSPKSMFAVCYQEPSGSFQGNPLYGLAYDSGIRVVRSKALMTSGAAGIHCSAAALFVLIILPGSVHVRRNTRSA